MKRINDDEFNFVVKHYKKNRLDTDAAWKEFKQNTTNEKRRNKWKKISVAASMLLGTCIAVACIFIGYNHFKSVSQHEQESVTPVTNTICTQEKKDSIKVFKFKEKPVGDVLKELSSYYGKTLSTSDSTKILSGEIEATSCEDVVDIIENTLDIKILVK